MKRNRIKDCIVADNVEVSKDEMLDYLQYVSNKGTDRSETIETILEYIPNVNDSIEVSTKVITTKGT